MTRAELARGPALAHAAALVALGLAAYAGSFSVPFHLDDGGSIVENPAVRDLGTFLSGPVVAPRSVAYFTFALNGSLGGTSPWGYHALNLAIHLAAALVLYALVALVCRTVAPPESALHRGAGLAAFAAAALFVAHPLQTQAVTYVVQRMASLAALFYLLAAFAYARAALDPDRARRAAWYAGALASAVLALFTKENAATVAGALALLEVCVLPGPVLRRAARLVPFVALTALAAIVLAAPSSIRATTSEFNAVARAAAVDVPAWTAYAWTQPAVVLGYLRLLVLPIGQSIDHDPVLATSLTSEVILSTAALAAIIAIPAIAGFRARRTGGGRVALLAVGWFVVTMLVESSVIPIADAMVEHRMYLPSAGIFLGVGALFAWAVERASPRDRSVALALGAACVLALAGATVARNRIWRDPLTLWTDAMQKAPALARPHVYVGQALMARGEVERAIPLLEAATRLRPRSPLADLSLGRAYAKLGRVDEAERAMRGGLALGGDRVAGAYLELGNLLRDAGRIEDACEAYRAEAERHRSSREARSNLVVCALARGDVAGAAAGAERLVREDPQDARMLFNLGFAAAQAGDPVRASDAYRRFLAIAGPELAPQIAAARQWLGERAAAADR